MRRKSRRTRVAENYLVTILIHHQFLQTSKQENIIVRDMWCLAGCFRKKAMMPTTTPNQAAADDSVTIVVDASSADGDGYCATTEAKRPRYHRAATAGTGPTKAIHIVDRLPPDLIRTSILSPFCDGTSLFHLAIALSMPRGGGCVGGNTKPSEGGDDDDGDDDGDDSANHSASPQERATFQSILEETVAARERPLLDGPRHGSSSSSLFPVYHTELWRDCASPNELRDNDEADEEGPSSRRPAVDQESARSCCIYRRLMALDRYEMLGQLPPNLIWGGRMRFIDNGVDDLDLDMQVLILTNNPSTSKFSSYGSTNWSIEHACRWNAILGPSGAWNGGRRDMNKIHMEMFNFVQDTCTPHGRICGATAADRQALKKVRTHLEATDLIGSLRYHRFPVGFYLRIISYAQARKRWDLAFRGRLPLDIGEDGGSDGHCGIDYSESLLCCWDISNGENKFSESSITEAQEIGAIRNNLKAYRQRSTD